MLVSSGGKMESLDRIKQLSVWVRTILALVLIVVVGGIWGFVAVAFGFPIILISIGTLAIGYVVFTQFFGDKNSPGSN
jgi:hypothetical protein